MKVTAHISIQCLLVALSIATFSSYVHAGKADDLCQLMTPEKNGLRCEREHFSDGSTPLLRIKIYARSADDAQRKAQTKLSIREVIDAHLQDGGSLIQMRTTRADGVTVERSCAKIHGKMRELCEAWVPVKG